MSLEMPVGYALGCFDDDKASTFAVMQHDKTIMGSPSNGDLSKCLTIADRLMWPA